MAAEIGHCDLPITKVETDQTGYSVSIRDTAERGMGLIDNHHLNHLV
jgi:hypothetical protein